MTNIIRKTWNTYKRHDGYIMGWERSEVQGVGHSVSMLDQEKNNLTFQWRSGIEPSAGQRVSVIMVEEGVTIRPDRPVMIMNHDTGEVIREQNAPAPLGTRPIMLRLWIWILAAFSVAFLLAAYSEGVTRMAIILMSAAFVAWRMAIATSELRYEDKAQKRIQDEEKLCLEVMTGAWRLASEERIDMEKGQAE